VLCFLQSLLSVVILLSLFALASCTGGDSGAPTKDEDSTSQAAFLQYVDEYVLAACTLYMECAPGIYESLDACVHQSDSKTMPECVGFDPDVAAECISTYQSWTCDEFTTSLYPESCNYVCPG
jgi:hypothetical protein